MTSSAVGNNLEHTLFISDLHLCASRPLAIAAFIDFIHHQASKAQSLYMLGDIFEYWAGDDSVDNHALSHLFTALRALSDNGVALYIMHGNRDFLMGNQFAQAIGATLLEDPSIITLYQKRILISHGDALCTDDSQYQQFRQQVRNPAWIAQFLSQPLSKRNEQISSIRQQSEDAKSKKAMAIMDVNLDAVDSLLRTYDYPDFLIHGHTHRPQQHLHTINSHSCIRWVLGDWYEQASCLRLDQYGCQAIQLGKV